MDWKIYLEHKDYYGSVEFISDDNTLYGSIIGINDLITYEAASVDELKKAFIVSVEDYLETCNSIGKEPNKFFNRVF